MYMELIKMFRSGIENKDRSGNVDVHLLKKQRIKDDFWMLGKFGILLIFKNIFSKFTTYSESELVGECSYTAELCNVDIHMNVMLAKFGTLQKKVK